MLRTFYINCAIFLISFCILQSIFLLSVVAKNTMDSCNPLKPLKTNSLKILKVLNPNQSERVIHYISIVEKKYASTFQKMLRKYNLTLDSLITTLRRQYVYPSNDDFYFLEKENNIFRIGHFINFKDCREK